MMLDRIHPSIRKALLLFCIVFTGAITAVVLSGSYLEGVQDNEKKATNSMRIWKSKIETAKANNNIIVEYEKPYLKLIEDGIVGEEKRLSWFEALQTTASSRGLNTFHFSTTKQSAVKHRDISGNYSSLNIYRSNMDLSMQVSHEGDLFAVFNDLSLNAKGLYSIDSCNISGVKGKIDATNEFTSSLSANCKLSWHTIKPNES